MNNRPLGLNVPTTFRVSTDLISRTEALSGLGSLSVFCSPSPKPPLPPGLDLPSHPKPAAKPADDSKPAVSPQILRTRPLLIVLQEAPTHKRRSCPALFSICSSLPSSVASPLLNQAA